MLWPDKGLRAAKKFGNPWFTVWVGYVTLALALTPTSLYQKCFRSWSSGQCDAAEQIAADRLPLFQHKDIDTLYGRRVTQCSISIYPLETKKMTFFDFKIQGGLGPMHPLRRPWCRCIFKTFHRCFVNIYRHGFKSLARRDLKSMHFVHVVTFILVNHSFFAEAFFVSIIKILQFVHLFFSLLTTVFYIYKGPLLSFSQGPHVALIRTWR